MTLLAHESSAADPSVADPSAEEALLKQLIEIQNQITAGEMDSAAVMRLIVERTRALLNADGASLEMVDGDELHFRCTSGSLTPFLDMRMPMAGSLSGASVASGEALYCRDAHTDPRVNRVVSQRLGVRSMVVVPMSHKGAVIGVLRTVRKDPDGFNPRDTRFLRLMTGFMGAALMHARDSEMNQRLLTERTQAVAALQESEERFRKACEDASIGMALVALDGRWIKVNRALCEIVGYTEAQLLATDFQSITHPDDLDADLSLLKQLMAGEIRTYQLQKRYIHRAGHHVWIQLNSSLVRNAANEPIYLVSQVQDITERHRMESALRDSDRAHRTLFELAGAGMANVDLKDGRFITVNQKLCELLGYTKEELCARSIFDLSLPEDRSSSQQRIGEMASNSSRLYAFKKRYVRKDGQTIWVAIDATSFVDGNGKPTHVVAMFRDITEHRLAEELMRASERQFRTLADHAPVAIFQSDPEGNNLFANARWCRMTGMSAAQAQGKGWMAAVHPDDLPTLFEARRAAVAAGSEFSAQYRYIRPDGEFVWVQGSAAPLRDDEGRIIGYLGTATDQTDRKLAEWLESDRGEVLEMVAKDQPLEAVLQHIVRLLERQITGSICAVIRPHHDHLKLEAPSMSPEMIAQLKSAPLSLAVGCLHDAANDPDGVGVSQLEVDPFWISMRSTLATAGLRVAWTAPIASSTASPLGWLTVFSRKNRRPTRSEAKLLLMVSKLATISIEHHQTTHKLAHLVRHDTLTGLPNRLMLDDRLDQAIRLARRSGKSVALMVLDIDKFKNVNDTLGHHAGDQLLKGFGQRLSALLRKTDTMARYGGDEFVIVLPEVNDAAGVTIVAQKLIDAMIEPFKLDNGASYSASTSIGIAFYPADASDAFQLQQAADAALYRVKANGRNSYQIYQPRTAA